MKKIFWLFWVSSVIYNVYVYVFINLEGVMYEGSDDDGEYGVGWVLLWEMKDNNIKNCVVVVFRWFYSKIGFCWFCYILEIGLSVIVNMV